MHCGNATILMPGQGLLVNNSAMGMPCPGISAPQQDQLMSIHMWDFPLQHLQIDLKVMNTHGLR